MPKAGTVDDNMFPELVKEKPKQKRGTQEDGTYITSTGEVLPAKNRERREPYPEPEEKQVEGNEEIVQNPDGDLAFACIRMGDVEWRRIPQMERKRQQLRYKVTETYAGKPRTHYSYDELEQIRKGEMVR